MTSSSMSMNNPISPNHVIKSGLCIGCGSCVAQQNEGAKMAFDCFGQLVPTGPQQWLDRPSKTLSQTCPFSPHAPHEDQLSVLNFPQARHSNHLIGRYERAYVGYSNQIDIRANGSSGGMVSWVATTLLDLGLIDGIAHVVPVIAPSEGQPLFQYRISRTQEELQEGAKSRYYPTDLSQILSLITATPGKYAVVGIPCFIKAVQLLRNTNPVFKERIRYTLGLFCGHMKSSKMVESFALQSGIPFQNVATLDFRAKQSGRPANLYFAKFSLKNGQNREYNWELLADGDWGAGFFMNSACNFCDDVVSETADISFGDAWIEPYSSDDQGTNVVIVRSKGLLEILKNGIHTQKLELKEVNAAFVQQTQDAGLRHRREGLSFRLSVIPPKLALNKRVSPAYDRIPISKRISYRLRYLISFWSHRVFWLANKVGKPLLYIIWAKIIGKIYHQLIYHRILVATLILGFKAALIAMGTNLLLSLVIMKANAVPEQHDPSEAHLVIRALVYPFLFSMILTPLFIFLRKRNQHTRFFKGLAVLLLCSIFIVELLLRSSFLLTVQYAVFALISIFFLNFFFKKPVI